MQETSQTEYPMYEKKGRVGGKINQVREMANWWKLSYNDGYNDMTKAYWQCIDARSIWRQIGIGLCDIKKNIKEKELNKRWGQNEG